MRKSAGSGWYYESNRHALAAQGIETGRKAYEPMPTPRPAIIPSRIQPQYSSWTDTSFKINDHIEIMAGYRKMRDGFNHYAVLYVDGVPVDEVKTHYINRTWESYDFQSVMQQLVNKTKDLSPVEKEVAKSYLAKDHTDWSDFKAVSMIAKLGDVLTDTQKEKNDWKERMLKAGLGGRGLEMPDDWDKLDENTKQARLDAAIKFMGETGNKESSPPTHEYAETSYQLEPRYDARSSFYGKAKISTGNNRTTLSSYGTDVAYIENGKAVVKGTYSDTTLRHIKEFLKQNGFKAENQAQILKDYKE